MTRLLLLLALIAVGHCSLPRPQTSDEAALKRFLMRNNRLPYSNETVTGDSTNQPNARDWTTCEGCKLLVTELRAILKNPQKVEDLKQLLSRVCNMGIMSHYKAECLNMVNNLIAVLHEIEPILDNPTAVCQELQYCPTGASLSVSPAKHLALLLGMKAMEIMHPGRTNDVMCDECIFAISELKSLVQSASIQAELKQELHKICRMAGQYESECSAMVDQYFDLLIQEVVQFLNNGRQVCVDIGFCNATGSASRPSVPLVRARLAETRTPGRVPLRRISAIPTSRHLESFAFLVSRLQTRQGFNAGCLVCQAAIKEAVDLLSQERVATLVTTDLTNFVCDLIPESMKSGCVDFMKIYSRAFLQLVISQYTPAQICTAIEMCKPEDERKIAQLSPEVKSAATCEACQVFSQYLSFEFRSPDFQQEVISYLKNTCSILPGDYKVQVRCQTLVQTYMPFIMENVLAPKFSSLCSCEDSLVNYVPNVLVFFADYLSRNVVCATLKMCPGPQQIMTTPVGVAN